MRINEVDKHLSHVELDQLEVFADRLFAKVGIDVEFTRHFLDRVNDDRNVKQITASELTRLFKQEYKRWGKPIAQLGPDAEAVMKDLATDLNIPFALRWDKENNELDLIAKTVMRKKNFKTSNREFEVQSVDYSLDTIQHKKVFESIQQLNEAGPAVAVVPIGIIAWQAYVYARYAQAAWFGLKFTAVTAAAYIVANPNEFPWLERKMAASAIIANNLWDQVRGVEDMSSETSELVAGVTSTLNTELTAGIDTLTNDALAANEISAATLANSQQLANDRIEQIANASDAEAKASAQTKASDASLIALSTEIAQANADARATALSDKNLIALGTAYAATQADLRATELSDAKLIAIGTEYAAQQAQLAHAEMQNARINSIADASDKASALALATAQQTAHAEFQNNRIEQLANASDAEAKASAQTKASDNNLIALATAISSTKAQQANDAYQNDKIASVSGASDAEAALAKSIAQTQAHATFQNDRIASIAGASDAEAALAKSIAQQQAHSTMQNDRIASIAGASDAEAKANAQTKASDAKLIALGQQVAQQNAQTKANAQTAASDAKLIALGQAYKDAQVTAKSNAQTAASDAKLIALAQAYAAATAKVATKVTPTGHHDTSMTVPAATATITGPTTSHHDTSMTVPAAGATATAATATAATAATAAATSNNTNNNNNNKKRTAKKIKKKNFGAGGRDDLWKTNLYKWVQKYGTFENENLVKKYFMITEGGAMPGVGAIHIDEINPTLTALETSIGVDLKNHVLGSVGKRQFSGDIDVALDIKTEELPAFVEALKKNPLVLDIAKSSVIMTKVKITDFDESKTDGRPRTGFVQVDFMPGDPGWMKTYYHSPSESESKYKGVYRNIMIASMAAVLDRQMSDAKLDDGRAMEELRYMWSPTEGLLRVKRTPVPKKTGEGYTKKNNNETIEGPWKQPDEIAKVLKLDSSTDLNSFESLLTAMKKNWTKEAQAYVIQGFKDNHVIKDIGIPDELGDL